MSQARDYPAHPVFAADAAVVERTAFIRRTYAHLAGAILAFVGLEWFVLSTPTLYEPMIQTMVGGQWSWLIVIIVFMAAGWVAQSWANNATSPAMQYAGLGLYTLAWVVMFVPLLYFAERYGGANVIPTAGLLTTIIFVGLTGFVFISKADFSFLRGFLAVGMLGAMGFILASILMGFSLGLVFTSAMITLMAGYILYDTSNVLHHYRTDQHVAAALKLFASVAMLFWYVVQLVMALSGRN